MTFLINDLVFSSYYKSTGEGIIYRVEQVIDNAVHKYTTIKVRPVFSLQGEKRLNRRLKTTNSMHIRKVTKEDLLGLLSDLNTMLKEIETKV